MKRISLIFALAAAAMMSSCEYRQYAPADYPESKVYIPAASYGEYISPAGDPVANTWLINGKEESPVFVATGGKKRYDLDLGSKKLIIHLGAVQSGITLKECTVQLSSAKSVVNRLIDDGTFETEILPLPESVYKFPEEVSFTAGKDAALFDLEVNVNYLKDPEYIGRKFAVAIKLTSDVVATNPEFETVIVIIDPSFLLN